MVETSEALAAGQISGLIQQNSFESGFKNRESLMRNVCGSEFQTDGDENWKPSISETILSSKSLAVVLTPKPEQPKDRTQKENIISI